VHNTNDSGDEIRFNWIYSETMSHLLGNIMNNPKMKDVIPFLLMALFAGAASCTQTGAIEPGDHDKSQAELKQEFKKLDLNRDSYLSLEEFQAFNKDDLAFKAADINDDGRIDLNEFIQYSEAKAADRKMQQT